MIYDRDKKEEKEMAENVAVSTGAPTQVRLSEARDQRMRTLSVAADAYRIGTVGTSWGPDEKQEWLAQTVKKRSYIDEVVAKLDKLDPAVWDVRDYGALTVNPALYPLKAVLSRNWDAAKPTVLVTGGVHGYETSGVQGAVLFLASRAADYTARFNIVVCPCVSPWGYEHIERWNPKCIDPNRSFGQDSSTHTEESAAVKKFLASLGVEGASVDGAGWVCHVDCHETTNTDETEFMPARAALTGAVYKPCTIPDGFYLVGDSLQPQTAFHTDVIASVRKVTHIAPADAAGTIIEEPITQEGVVVVPAAKLGLCASVTPATFATTTEVYPDSPLVTDAQCNDAQVAAIVGALDHISGVRGL